MQKDQNVRKISGWRKLVGMRHPQDLNFGHPSILTRFAPWALSEKRVTWGSRERERSDQRRLKILSERIKTTLRKAACKLSRDKRRSFIAQVARDDNVQSDYLCCDRATSSDNCPTMVPSPPLQIRFELFEAGLAVFYPDSEPFQEPEEILVERD